MESKQVKKLKVQPERPLRADAQRNLEKLLHTALEVFDSVGVNAPVREIAKKAGVGIGTIYRHFPKRSDLTTAVLCSEVDTCARKGQSLLLSPNPSGALIEWINYYVEFVTARKGLAKSMSSEDPAFKALAPYFQEKLLPVIDSLLTAAIYSGKFRKDIQPEEILCGIGALCTPTEYADRPDPRRLIEIFIHGLKG